MKSSPENDLLLLRVALHQAERAASNLLYVIKGIQERHPAMKPLPPKTQSELHAETGDGK